MGKEAFWIADEYYVVQGLLTYQNIRSISFVITSVLLAKQKGGSNQNLEDNTYLSFKSNVAILPSGMSLDLSK